MCTKLLQVYACGHNKPICGTPCPHALSTGQPPSSSIPSTPRSSNSQTPAPPPPPPPPPYSTSNASTAGDSSPKPNFCALFFAKRLPASRHPCLRCYLKPEWEPLKVRWVKDYLYSHPNTKPEDLERLSGIEGIAEQAGLLNVFEAGVSVEESDKKGA
ncbi:hypothetical protein BS50DRAFT_592287 [Corynespora cassiicola Philippines]|uniref:Uncharacterized protein n=1 Tax=Corynespora cassiicola Philippines TaxID=1448308 RepID=A0A2T2N9G7_CORCC|nr:hypothetical protein BS50DRAFT_592287 [Corynespora cassiicola Philippines]